MYDEQAASGRSAGDGAYDLGEQTSRRGFRDPRRLARGGFQRRLDVRTASAPLRRRAVSVTVPADAGVTAGQIRAALAGVRRAIVRAARALVHVHAQPEPGGPLVAGPSALAAHVHPVRAQRPEVAILVAVQRALSMRCERTTKRIYTYRALSSLKRERRARARGEGAKNFKGRVIARAASETVAKFRSRSEAAGYCLPSIAQATRTHTHTHSWESRSRSYTPSGRTRSAVCSILIYSYEFRPPIV